MPAKNDAMQNPAKEWTATLRKLAAAAIRDDRYPAVSPARRPRRSMIQPKGKALIERARKAMVMGTPVMRSLSDNCAARMGTTVKAATWVAPKRAWVTKRVWVIRLRTD